MDKGDTELDRCACIELKNGEVKKEFTADGLLVANRNSLSVCHCGKVPSQHDNLMENR